MSSIINNSIDLKNNQLLLQRKLQLKSKLERDIEELENMFLNYWKSKGKKNDYKRKTK